MPSHNLTSVLQSLGRRLLTLNLVMGVAWGVTAAILCVLLGVWLDLVWEMRPELRIACLLMASVATLGMVGILALTTMKRRTPLALARRIDGVAGTGGQVVTGVDLLMEHQRFTEVSSGLAKIAVDQAAQKAASVPSGKVVPVKPLWWAVGSVVGMALLVLILCLLMPGIALAEWNRFTDPYNIHGDHAPFTRIVFDVKPGHAKVLYGSGLDIEVTTSGALVEKVELVMQGKGAEEVLPLFPEPGGKWRATLASVTESGHYHVRAPGGRSEKYRIDVITVPRLEKVSFVITPPAYTNRPAYQGPLPQGGIAGLPGTKVEVRALSNRPLKGGTLELTGPKNETAGTAEVKPLTPNSMEVRAEFTIKQPGKMHLRIQDLDNQFSTDTFVAPITLLADERPFIRIMEPKETSFATPDSLLPVQLVAEDDYGIARIQLFRSLNDSRAVPMDIAVKTPAPTYWASGVTLPLSSYGLQVGDELKFFARVEDNDPAGAKGGESNVVIVRIISQEEFEAMVRQREGLEVLLSKYQQAQRRMEKLAEEMEKLEKELGDQKPQEGEMSKEMREKMEKLAEEMKKEADAIKESAKHLLPYDLDKNLNKELEKLGEKVDEAAKEMKKTSGQPKLSNSKAGEKVKDLRKKMGGDQKEFNEKATEPLEHLSKIYPLMEDANRFVELYQQQKDLADRLQSLKGKDQQDDPQLKARMRDLQGEQQRLREDLGRLLDDIEKHAQELPDDEKLMELKESAMTFALEVRASGANEAMQEAEDGLGEFSGTKGAVKSREAEQILEKFISKCKSGMCEKGEGALKFNPSLSQNMGDTLNQMLGESFGRNQGSGQGQGMGQGSGFSSRRGNVGMYGNMPAVGQNMSGGGFGKRNQPNNPTANRGGTIKDNQATGPNATTTPGTAAGRADINVPPQYRKKTADYFQRLVEGAGGK